MTRSFVRMGMVIPIRQMIPVLSHRPGVLAEGVGVGASESLAWTRTGSAFPVNRDEARTSFTVGAAKGPTTTGTLGSRRRTSRRTRGMTGLGKTLEPIPIRSLLLGRGRWRRLICTVKDKPKPLLGVRRRTPTPTFRKPPRPWRTQASRLPPSRAPGKFAAGMDGVIRRAAVEATSLAVTFLGATYRGATSPGLTFLRKRRTAYRF
jgi:hypothetical protein